MSETDFITTDEAESRWPDLFDGKSVPEFKDPEGNTWIREVDPPEDPRSSMGKVQGYRLKRETSP